MDLEEYIFMWKDITRIQVHELRVRTHEFRVQIHELRVQIHELGD